MVSFFPPIFLPEINFSSPPFLFFWLGEKAGNEPEEVKLQNASKQIVQNAILQAVRQVSQESRCREDRTSDNRGRFQLGVGELTKKHEKK
ncbi:A-kinase anchor protein inhibitor 1 [Carlito syrichta]|uniref:A-kinase anchor protein inhibitor 1 n=1 Tax=Carlito syrichta TaxID=1868482 RepID=A0A3Q0DYP9_CARSF|nr:A-kinase anchor protein inhibitor 1 [Carlito syrichta]